MDKYKKFMYIGIFILLISLVSSAGTYAWFTWISPSNTSVTLSIGNLADVTFTSGPDINISTDGVSTTFTVRNANSTDSLLYKVKLEITSIANELKNESFKYTLLKDNKVVKTGNLKDAVSGNTLILNTSSLDKGSTSSPKISTFKLYFWIDGNIENNFNIMNKSLVGNYDITIGSNNTIYANPSSFELFSNLTNVTSIDLSNMDTSGVINMSNMFSDNTSLTNITFGDNFNTANVINMSGMFKNCTILKTIDLSSFDTSNATLMGSMFMNCQGLQNLDLKSFNTSNVTNMLYMFYNCSSLTSLDLSSFNTSNVERMDAMFYNCSSLISLDLSNFDTSKITDMTYMFNRCKSLTSINLSSFDTSNVSSLYDTFAGLTSLKVLDLSSFDTSKVTNMGRMFLNSNNLVTIYVSDLWNISNVTAASRMFEGCTSLKGAVPYDSSKTDASMANYTNGYLTKKL